MPETDRPLRGQPHRTPWYWNLLGLYDRQSRPMATYFDDLDAEDQTSRALAESAYERLFTLAADRRRRYEIYDEMDTYGLVSGILDVYAEESTQRDYDRGVSAWVESKNAAMVRAGEECFRNCQVEDRIAAIVRRMLKYGDAFQRLLYATEKGVLGWRFSPTLAVSREEDKYQRLVGFKQEKTKFRAGKRDVSWPWDFIHFRLLGKREESTYGTSLLDGLFRSWRRMTLTEESILMYRLRRVPDRNLIMVNVGNMEEHEAMAFVNRWRKRFRKHELVDPATPEYKKQYNPLTPLEDIFVPLIEGRESRVELLAGSGTIGEVYDLDHFRDEFFGSAKVPKAYFGFEGDINAKATLMQQDVRFARTCKRIQRAAIFGLRQLCDVHYVLLQKPGAGKNEFDPTLAENAYMVQMSPISYLDEFERLELIQLRYQIVEAMSRLAQDMQLDPRVWATYVLLNYAKLPEDLVLKLIKKTPDQVATGGGVGFEAQDAETRDAILDNDGKARLGYVSLSEDEQLAIAKCVHDSPMLRRSIASWAEYGAEPDPMTAGLRQTDPSLLPPVSNGITISDGVEDNAVVKQLHEDLEALREAGDGREVELAEG